MVIVALKFPPHAKALVNVSDQNRARWCTRCYLWPLSDETHNTKQSKY